MEAIPIRPPKMPDHPAGVPLLLTIDCASGPDGRLMLLISDDGVGLPDNFDPLKDGGLGFRFIRSLATERGQSWVSNPRLSASAFASRCPP